VRGGTLISLTGPGSVISIPIPLFGLPLIVRGFF